MVKKRWNAQVRSRDHHVTFVRNAGRYVYPIRDEAAQNMHIANMLVNHYLEDKESVMGIMKGSQVPGTTGRVFQYLNRLFSFDALLSILGFSQTHGAAEVAQRSQKFSEHLARAPHVAGLIKMVLIAIFPFLVFFIVAGKWRVLVYSRLPHFAFALFNSFNVLQISGSLGFCFLKINNFDFRINFKI